MKRPNAKAIGLPDVGGEFGSCSVCLIIGILQNLNSNAFLTALTHHIYKGVTLHASYARCKCMGVLYCKLAAFTPNTKNV
ncbi:SsrA-binding protein [Helicobacter pylori]|uniref:SsrA-binding protein n=1 Tax=Helicobacter pylori TaxID=210 RepID=UPI0013DE233C|nr:SsrA-binding protein [Helicobacter pylori]